MDLISALKVQWDRSFAFVLALLGGFALILGYVGVSGEAYLARQMPYIISGGFTGIFLLGVSATLWLSADLRDEWRELHVTRTLLEDRPLSAALVLSGPNGFLPSNGPAGVNGAMPARNVPSEVDVLASSSTPAPKRTKRA